MPGALDPRCVLARAVLLDALEALGNQRSALTAHFADARAAGPQMAARAAGDLMPGDVVAGSCAALVSDLLRALRPNQ